MRSNVQVGGHPLHPIIVTVAIGAFISAFIFDIAALATGAPTWFAMSFWTLLIGVCAGALSAVTGLYDYLTLGMSDGARKTATNHMLLNVTLMILFIISVILKGTYAAGGPEPVPSGRIVSTFILDLIGVLLLLASGWLGGEIVYRHGVAVLEEAAGELRGGRATGTTPAMGTLGGERPAGTEDPEQP
jgi:uncharacterized membrane protein